LEKRQSTTKSKEKKGTNPLREKLRGKDLKGRTTSHPGRVTNLHPNPRSKKRKWSG